VRLWGQLLQPTCWLRKWFRFHLPVCRPIKGRRGICRSQRVNSPKPRVPGEGLSLEVLQRRARRRLRCVRNAVRRQCPTPAPRPPSHHRPTTVMKPSIFVIASAYSRGLPAANGANSNTPIGPFQNTVRAPLSGLREKAGHRIGTDIPDPTDSAAMASTATTIVLRRRRAEKPWLPPPIGWGKQNPTNRRGPSRSRQVSSISPSSRDLPDLVPLCLEGTLKHIPPPMSRRSTVGKKRLDDGELVGEPLATTGAPPPRTGRSGLAVSRPPTPRPRASTRPPGRNAASSFATSSYTLGVLGGATAPETHRPHTRRRRRPEAAANSAPARPSSLVVSPGLNRRFLQQHHARRPPRLLTVVLACSPTVSPGGKSDGTAQAVRSGRCATGAREYFRGPGRAFSDDRRWGPMTTTRAPASRQGGESSAVPARMRPVVTDGRPA